MCNLRVVTCSDLEVPPARCCPVSWTCVNHACELGSCTSIALFVSILIFRLVRQAKRAVVPPMFGGIVTTTAPPLVVLAVILTSPASALGRYVRHFLRRSHSRSNDRYCCSRSTSCVRRVPRRHFRDGVPWPRPLHPREPRAPPCTTVLSARPRLPVRSFRG